MAISTTFTGYNSVRSEHAEPVKGGIRYAMSVDQDEVEAHGADDLQMRIGGRNTFWWLQGGLRIDPREWEPDELEGALPGALPMES
ncbi:MAG: Glu/Leu/Phe/Val dehydrogenase dimerization domain-containing protein [Nitratireductor sp.]